MKFQAHTFIFFSFILVLFALACSESPILNHRMAEKPKFSASCGAKLGSRCVSWSWVTPPKVSERLKIRLVLSAPLVGELVVDPYHPSMGHGSWPTQVEALSEFEYQVSDVVFNMGGDWILKVQHIVNGRTVEETTIDVQI